MLTPNVCAPTLSHANVSVLALGSGRKRSFSPAAQAAWARCIASATRGGSAKSRSRSFPSRLRLTQIASRDFNVRPRQLIGCTARPWSRRPGLIGKILTTGDCRPRYQTAIVVSSRRHASSQWTAAHAILHIHALRPSSEDRLDSWKEIAAPLKRFVRDQPSLGG